MKRATKDKFHRYKVIIDTAIVIIAIVIWLSGLVESRKASVLAEGTIEVHVIDVGQGDCTLIRTEKGNILIDSGSNSSEEELVNYLKRQRIKSFEYCIFSHPDEDHIGGADRILSQYDVKNVLMPKKVESTTTYERMMSALEESGAKLTYISAGDEFAFSDVLISALAPVSVDKYHDTNNTSAVTRFSYGDMDFLFMGDAEYIEEADILIEETLLPTEFLKVGHHGSSTSTTAEFLYAVKPEIAVISSGKDNTYGHPSYETLERLGAVGADCYRTDQEGSIVFVCDGNTIERKK